MRWAIADEARLFAGLARSAATPDERRRYGDLARTAFARSKDPLATSEGRRFERWYAAHEHKQAPRSPRM